MCTQFKLASVTSVKSNGDSFVRRLDFCADELNLRLVISAYMYRGIFLANQSTVESPYNRTSVSYHRRAFVWISPFSRTLYLLYLYSCYDIISAICYIGHNQLHGNLETYGRNFSSKSGRWWRKLDLKRRERRHLNGAACSGCSVWTGGQLAKSPCRSHRQW